MAGREHETEFARLQASLTSDLARLDALRPDSPDYDDVASQVIAAAQELVAHEERMPRLLDEQPRRVTLILLRTAGALTMALAAGIAVGVVSGRAWWWLAIAVLLAVAGARLLMTRVGRAQADHLRQRVPAGLVLAGGAAAGLGDLGLATAWLLAAAAVLVAGGLVLLLPPAVVRVEV